MDIPKHNEVLPSTVSDEYSCVCGSIYRRRGSLISHLKSHTDAKSFICHICSKAFRQNIHLEIHIRTHSGEKPFKCETCDKEYSSKRSLKIHQVVHSKERAFQCDICHKKFSYHDNLKRHIRKHSGIKPFTCGICSKSFSEQQFLALHMRVHSDEKPFECDTCGKKFARKQMLQCHFAVHSNEKAFKCKKCPKRFGHRSDAIKHEKIHSGIKPFTCTLCPSRFYRKGHLTRHNNTHIKKIVTAQVLSDKEHNINKTNACEFTMDSVKVEKNNVIECDGVLNNEKIYPSNSTKLKNPNHDEHGEQRKIRNEEIQIVSNDSHNMLVSDGVESIGTTSDEVFDFSERFGNETITVLIGRENENGEWVYEEVQTTIERRVGDGEEMEHQSDEFTKKEIDDKTNISAPWKCGLCGLNFTEKVKLCNHIKTDHVEFSSPQKHGSKLVVNKTSGELEEKPMTHRQEMKSLSIDTLQTVFKQYYIKRYNKSVHKQFVQKAPRKTCQLDNNKANVVNKFTQDSSDLEFDSKNKCKSDSYVFNNSDDFKTILDERNYESNKEKQIIKGIQDNDYCFVIIVDNESKQQKKFQLIRSSFYPEVNNHDVFNQRAQISPKKCNNVEKGDQHGSSVKKGLVCLQCGKDFKFLSRLKLHMQTHSGKRPFVCTKCGKEFTQNRNLLIHSRTHTGDTPYQCNVCGLHFDSMPKLKRHIQRHSDVKPFECNICHAKYVKKSDLRIHKDKHSGNINFRCQICSESFTRHSGLLGHMRTHSGERPFLCKLCGVRFRLKSSLSRHCKLHKKPRKLYKCSLCPKQLTSLRNRSLHEDKHRGHKQFMCSICVRTFHRKYYLDQHKCTISADGKK